MNRKLGRKIGDAQIHAPENEQEGGDHHKGRDEFLYPPGPAL
tara:strand:+ start:570 stop:695 length:126 start_codon:yes stop_codon:yes gene_type:complete